MGRLITITSAAVKQPIDNLILSNAVRSAVTGLMKSLSNEYAPHNVLVNNVCPGYTLTARLDQLAARLATAKAWRQSRFAIAGPRDSPAPPRPAGRVRNSSSSSLRARSYVTGVSIAVDAGM